MGKVVMDGFLLHCTGFAQSVQEIRKEFATFVICGILTGIVSWMHFEYAGLLFTVSSLNMPRSVIQYSIKTLIKSRSIIRTRWIKDLTLISEFYSLLFSLNIYEFFLMIIYEALDLRPNVVHYAKRNLPVLNLNWNAFSNKQRFVN